jgi:hypothetical protein
LSFKFVIATLGHSRVIRAVENLQADDIASDRTNFWRGESAV